MKHFHSAASSSSLQQLHFPSLPLNHRQDEKNEKRSSKIYCNLQTRRDYSLTSKTENTSLTLGLAAIAATATAGQYAASAYKEWEDNQPEEPEDNSGRNQQAEDQHQDQQVNTNANANANTNASLNILGTPYDRNCHHQLATTRRRHDSHQPSRSFCSNSL